MKKIFKKSLACLIAVLMIVSSLPFATLTANAAETKSASVMKYGTIVKTNCTNRATGTALTIVNDNKDDNFDIGFVTFNVSNLSSTIISNANYTFNVSAESNRENLGLTLWYPTDHYDAFANSGNPNTADSAYAGDGTTSKKVDHITPAKNYFGMKHIKDLVLSTDSPRFNSAYSGTHTVDISSALQYAADNNKDYAVVCFMLTNNGEHDDSNGWSDTIVTVNTNNISVDITTDITAVKQYVKNNISSFNGYTGDASAPADNSYSKSTLVKRDDGISDTMQNVLYAFGTSDAPWNNSTTDILVAKAWTGGKYYVKTGLQYGNIVFLYDGQNEPSTVIMSYTQTSAEEGGMSALTPQGSDFSCPTRWHSSGVSGNSGKIYSTVKWGYGNGTNIRIGDSFKNDNAYFYNSLHYIGTPSKTITTFSNLTYDITVYSTSSDYNGSKGTITFGNSNTTNGTTSIYIVNYKPIKDAITSMKSVYAQIKANGDDAYCTSELNAFYEAAYNIMMFNPNSNIYDYGSDVSAVTAKVGDAIDDLKSKYVTTATTEPTKHNKVTSRENEVAATCTKAGSYEEVTKCSLCGKEFSREKKTIDALGHEYTYEYVDKTYHTKKCTRGDVEEQEKHTLDSNGTCTLCNKNILDYSAWNDAATQHITITINDISKYTNVSMDEYTALANQAIALKNSATTQAEVDKATAMLLSAQTVLRKRSVTVTLQIEYAHSDGTVKTYENQAYGSELEIDLADVAPSIKGVEKWTISTDDGATTTKLSSTDTKLTLYVTKSATVTVYELDEPTDSETVKYSKVVFLGKNGVIVGVRYVAENTELETNTVTVPQIPFYDNGEWDTTTVTGTGNTIYVRAKYTASTNEEDMCNVHFDGKSRKYSYDSFVRPDGIDPSKQYALASDAEGKNILTYLDGVEFYAPKTSDIYVVEVSERVAKTGITGHFAGSDDTHRWATYNCKFYLPENCTAIEWGLEVKYGANTKIMKAERISNGNEYTVIVRVKQGSTITNVSCRSYVTYKQGNETKTIYSDVAVDQAF